MKVTLEISNHTESTHAPYWLIYDSKATAIFSKITGLFFSREEAEEFLKMNSFDYSDHAQVYCFSGHRGRTYREAYERGQTVDNNDPCIKCNGLGFIYRQDGKQCKYCNTLVDPTVVANLDPKN